MDAANLNSAHLQLVRDVFGPYRKATTPFPTYDIFFLAQNLAD
jgi:hypothetical protein